MLPILFAPVLSPRTFSQSDRFLSLYFYFHSFSPLFFLALFSLFSSCPRDHQPSSSPPPPLSHPLPLRVLVYRPAVCAWPARHSCHRTTNAFWGLCNALGILFLEALPPRTSWTEVLLLGPQPRTRWRPQATTTRPASRPGVPTRSCSADRTTICCCELFSNLNHFDRW